MLLAAIRLAPAVTTVSPPAWYFGSESNSHFEMRNQFRPMNIQYSGGDAGMFAFLERRRSNLLLTRHRQSCVVTADNRFRCPCCGYKTLKAPAALGLCPVCWWEDDGQDDEDAEEVRLTVNGNLSLRDARLHYSDCGASDPRFLAYVRKPE